jgi:glycerol-3-phosphate acyltransferase PlsX
MSATHTLAVDAMGGDHAPRAVIEGLQIAAERYPAARFLLFGGQDELTKLLAANPRAAKVSTIRHTDQVVGPEMKIAQALRVRNSSLRQAVDAVARGEAFGAISAGNTAAIMAIAKLVLKTVPGIDRPAIAAIGPSARGDIVMLDLGANLVCDSRNLVEFAIMGDAFARTVLGLPHPTLGLLNVGSEEQKGNESLRQAADMLKSCYLAAQFHGFVEGHDIAAGTTDVVVSDGFSGNIALKTGEGALRLMADLLRQVFSTDLPSKIGYLLARPGLERLREWLDPRRYNGAVMLGLNGVVVKSHGGTDAEGFAYAVAVAMDMVVHQLDARIHAGLAQMLPEPALLPTHQVAG